MSANLICKFLLGVFVFTGALCLFQAPAIGVEQNASDRQAMKTCPFCGKQLGSNGRCIDCDDPDKWKK